MTTGLRKVWEWPACYGRSGYDLSRPILIFVAAKENGFACCGRRCNDPPRPILIFVAAKKMARLQNTTTPTDASILDFRPRLENRCKVLPGSALICAVILDFRPRLENRCKLLPVYALLRASILDFKAKLGNRCKDFPENNLLRAPILDFRPRLGNRCKDFPVYPLLRASILDFKAKLGNRCSIIVVAIENGPPAAQSWHLPCRNRRTATTFRVRFYSSSLQRRTARLQRSRGVQAGTGCHESGIILSKKPPEWHLSPPESTAPPHNTETLTPQLHPQQDLFKLLRPKSCSRIVSER